MFVRQCVNSKRQRAEAEAIATRCNDWLLETMTATSKRKDAELQVQDVKAMAKIG